MTHEKLVGVKIKNYTFLKEIGQGNYGRVYDVYDQENGYNYAAKVVPKALIKKTQKLMELLRSEIKVVKQCKNENVVGYIDNFTTDKNIILIMELCDGGELQQYLNKKKRLTEDQATFFLKQIINGFKGLHQVKAIHRDFKASNVLLHKNVCKIADLGFSRQLEGEDMATTVLGTSLYMAPEILDAKAYDRKADIWSVGVLYYQMIFGEYPYFAISVTDRKMLQIINANRPNYSKLNISEKVRDFMDKCLTVNPKQRINWNQIYDHPLIRQEQKLIYSLTSNIRLDKNKQYYNEQEKMEVAQHLQAQIFQDQSIEHTTMDIKNKVKEDEARKKRQASIIRYEKAYLNYRNKIMFIYKHLTPYISRLFKRIKANHHVAIFLICKHSYLQMKEFLHHLTHQINFLAIQENWQLFTSSPQYTAIKEKVFSELQLVQLQANLYKDQVPKFVNEEIRSQLDIYKISHTDWRDYYHKEVEKYELELMLGLQDLKGEFKEKLIRLLISLTYIREMKEIDEIEDFQRKMQNLDYEREEKFYRTSKKKGSEGMK